MGLPVPDWATEYALACKGLLGLYDWDITLRIVESVSSDGRSRAKTDVNSRYLYAYIFLRDDIEDNAEWRETILHEMGHVAQSELLDFIDRVMLLIPHDMRDHILDEFRTANERAVVRNTRAIARAGQVQQPTEAK